MLSNFKVSKLSLLKFTAFFYGLFTSLKRSEPHPVAWPKIAELIMSPTLPSSNLLSLTYTEVWFFLLFLPDVSLQRRPFLLYFVTLSWAVLVPYPRFMMVFAFPWRQVLCCPRATFCPHLTLLLFRAPSFYQGGAYTSSIPALHRKLEERYWGELGVLRRHNTSLHSIF